MRWSICGSAVSHNLRYFSQTWAIFIFARQKKTQQKDKCMAVLCKCYLTSCPSLPLFVSHCTIFDNHQFLRSHNQEEFVSSKRGRITLSTLTCLCIRGFSKQTLKQTLYFLHETFPCVFVTWHAFLVICALGLLWRFLWCLHIKMKTMKLQH